MTGHTLGYIAIALLIAGCAGIIAAVAYIEWVDRKERDYASGGFPDADEGHGG